MSLFQAKEWWSHKAEFPSECSSSCLIVCNIDADPNNYEKIITGSFTGHLRIFSPSSRSYQIEDLVCEVNLDEPILQIAAGRFISGSSRLALAVLFPKKLSVYLVNPVGRTQTSATTSAASYYELTHSYTHRFHHHSYSFTTGPFGGLQSQKDHIAILTLDAQLLFYEQETFAFSRYLSAATLIPGAAHYMAKIDSFIIGTSTMEVECYRYSMLGEANQGQQKQNPHHNDEEKRQGDQDQDHQGSTADQSAALKNNKKLQVDWNVNLGEPILEIISGRFNSGLPSGQQEILVLTKYSLFILKENGLIKTQKRLDYSPMSVHSYRVNPDQHGNHQGEVLDHLIIGAEEGAFYIYKAGQLVWAARTTIMPVSIRIGSFSNTAGLIVAQSDTNELLISYLGTTAPKHQTAFVSSTTGSSISGAKELNYEDMDTEHRKLQKVIKNAANDKLQEPKDKLLMKASCTTELVEHPCEDERIAIQRDEEGRQIAIHCTLSLHYNGPIPITNLHLVFNLPNAFYTPQNQCHLDSIHTIPMNNNQTHLQQPPFTMTLPIYLLSQQHPSSLHAELLCTYLNSENITRTARMEFRLPLCLIGRIQQPLKNNALFYTIDTNKSTPPPLNLIFADLFTAAIQNKEPSLYNNSTHIVTFVYYNYHYDVSILVSKKNGRFRLQASQFASFSIIAQELSLRLNNYYSSIENNNAKEEQINNGANPNEVLQLKYEDDIPLPEYFSLIEQHHTTKVKLLNDFETLNKFSLQFRAIQKRLLLRYKDKNPVPLIKFDFLLKDTYHKIHALCDAMNVIIIQYNEYCMILSNVTEFMVLLATWKYGLNKNNADFLSSLLHVHGREDRGLSMIDCSSQSSASISGVSLDLVYGWEERIDAALIFILKNILTKSYQKIGANAMAATENNNVGVNAVSMESIKEIGRVTKHLTLLFERLNKGMRFVLKAEEKGGAKNMSPAPGTPPASASGERRRQSAASSPGHGNGNTAPVREERTSQ